MFKKIPNNQGQNLIEVLFALALFLVFIVGAISLTFKYLATTQRVQELSQTKAIVIESFEAVQSISYNSWDSFADGIYGLNADNSSWQFQTEPNLINNIYTRSIIISPVQRDANCDIVASGGINDPDTKLVTVIIDWDALPLKQNKSFSKYYTRWYDPTTCIASDGQAGNLIIDVSAANIDATKKSLHGVELRNTGETPIILDKMTLTWTKPGEITYIKIEGTNYWHSTNGIGTPQGAQPSGTELDLVDLILEPDEDYEVDAFRFNAKVDGSTFTITAIMSDESSKTEVTTPPFVP